MYNGTKQAVADLYGAYSNEQLQNVKAWYAVGIGDGLLAVDDSVSHSAEFQIYPNPIKDGILNIEGDFFNSTYEIFDASGKLVKVDNGLKKGKNKITVPELKTGVYLIKVKTQDVVTSKKVLIQK